MKSISPGSSLSLGGGPPFVVLLFAILSTAQLAPASQAEMSISRVYALADSNTRMVAINTEVKPSEPSLTPRIASALLSLASAGWPYILLISGLWLIVMESMVVASRGKYYSLIGGLLIGVAIGFLAVRF